MTKKIKVSVPVEDMRRFSELLIEEGFEHSYSVWDGDLSAEFKITIYNEVNSKLTITMLMRKAGK